MLINEQPPDWNYWFLMVSLIQLHLDLAIWLSSL